MAKNKTFSLSNSLLFNNVSEQFKEEPVTLGNDTNKPANNTKSNKTNKTNENIATNNFNKIKSLSIKETNHEIKNIKNNEDNIRKTSVSIKRSSLNYLAYISKINEIKQNEYIANLISLDLEQGKIMVPDFNKVNKRRESFDMVVKGIQIPENLLKAAQKKAASQMKSISEYIDDLLQAEISNS